MDPTRGSFDDGILRVGDAVYVHRRDRSARDEFMALASVHGRLHDGTRVYSFVYHVPGRALTWFQLRIEDD